MRTWADTEEILKKWLPTTSVGPLVRQPGGAYSIYIGGLAKSNPNPAVVIRQIGGGPHDRRDIPEQRAHIQLDCWGTSRIQARDVSQAVMNELDEMPRAGGYVIDGVYLGTARIITRFWLPEPQSDTPRYIVEAAVTTIA